MAFDIRNRKLSDEEFYSKRKEVLNQWETGRQVADLEENIAAARELSRGKSYARTLAEHKKKGENLFEPQFGQALTKYMIEGITYVEANSDLFPHGVWTVFSDTYTRKGKFAQAAASVPNMVTDEDAEAVKRYFGEDGVVEILAVVSWYGFLNRWNDSLATELEEAAFDKASETLANTSWDAGKHRPKSR